MLSKPAGFKSKTSVGFTGSVFEIFCRFNFYWKKYPQKNHSHFRKVEDIASAFGNENLSIDTNPKTILIREQLKIFCKFLLFEYTLYFQLSSSLYLFLLLQSLSFENILKSVYLRCLLNLLPSMTRAPKTIPGKLLCFTHTKP